MTMEETAVAPTEPTAAECEHEAEAGTAYATTGLIADLRREDDYPADAKCLNCGQWIRRDELAAPWRLKYPERTRSAPDQHQHDTSGQNPMKKGTS